MAFGLCTNTVPVWPTRQEHTWRLKKCQERWCASPSKEVPLAVGGFVEQKCRQRKELRTCAEHEKTR